MAQVETRANATTGPVDFSYRDQSAASAPSSSDSIAVAVPLVPATIGEGGAVLTPLEDGGMHVEFPLAGEGAADASDISSTPTQQADGSSQDTEAAAPAPPSEADPLQEAKLDKTSRPPGFGWNHDTAQSDYERAKAIFGETEGLYPQSIDPNGKPDDPRNWQTDSWDNLALARRYIGIVAGHNPTTWWDAQSRAGQEEAWIHAKDAAEHAADTSLLDPKITHFDMRIDAGPTYPFGRLKPYLTMGPFRNVGGGSVPAGNNTYIDFYGR